MTASEQVNSPSVVGWLLMVAVIVLILAYLTLLLIHYTKRRDIRRNDARIIQAAEEARNDFS